jgi:hypothetical protein
MNLPLFAVNKRFEWSGKMHCLLMGGVNVRLMKELMGGASGRMGRENEMRANGGAIVRSDGRLGRKN